MKLTEITNQFLTNHDKIKAWLDEMGIENCTIAPDGKVSVEGDVNINSNKLTSIPVQFEEVSGHFICSDNELTSLEGCPSEVNSYFDCSGNELTSLEGCPSKVGGSFFCNENKLTSLVGCPSEVGDGFYCFKNKLTSLAGAPTKIGGGFYCNDNKLESLAGCPSKVGGNFDCHNNIMTTFIGISDLIKSIGGSFVSSRSLIKTGGLGLLLIENIEQIEIKSSKPFGIINKYIGRPDRIFECQEELIEAGLEEYAQL